MNKILVNEQCYEHHKALLLCIVTIANILSSCSLIEYIVTIV